MTYIQYMRKKLNLTKADFARKIEMPFTTYRRIELSTDLSIYSFQQLSKIATELDMTVDKMIYKSENFNKESV